MRQVALGVAPFTKNEELQAYIDWVTESLLEIERASFDDAITVVDSYTVANHTATRSLDASTAVLADVVDVVCTLIEDLKNRGVKRSR